MHIRFTGFRCSRICDSPVTARLAGGHDVGYPVGGNPDRELSAVARAEGWKLMRFEPLGRRLKAGVAMAGPAAVGVGGAPLARGYPDREPSSTAAQRGHFSDAERLGSRDIPGMGAGEDGRVGVLLDHRLENLLGRPVKSMPTWLRAAAVGTWWLWISSPNRSGCPGTCRTLPAARR